MVPEENNRHPHTHCMYATVLAHLVCKILLITTLQIRWAAGSLTGSLQQTSTTLCTLTLANQRPSAPTQEMPSAVSIGDASLLPSGLWSSSISPCQGLQCLILAHHDDPAATAPSPSPPAAICTQTYHQRAAGSLFITSSGGGSVATSTLPSDDRTVESGLRVWPAAAEGSCSSKQTRTHGSMEQSRKR